MHRVIKAQNKKLTWESHAPWHFDFDTVLAMEHANEAVEIDAEEFERNWTTAKKA